MVPAHPWIEAALALLVLVALPFGLRAAWRVAGAWRRREVPASRVEDLKIGVAALGIFVGVLVLLALGAGYLMHGVAAGWVLGFLAWQGVEVRRLWGLGGGWRAWVRDGLAAGPVYLAVLPWVALGVGISMAVGSWLGWEVKPQLAVRLFMEMRSGWQLAGLLVLACVVAPVAEEMVFRGLLYPALKSHLGRGPALGVSAVLFGAMHGEWAYFLSLSLLGGVLAWVYDQSGRLGRAVVLHVLFNSVTCAVLLASRALPPP